MPWGSVCVCVDVWMCVLVRGKELGELRVSGGGAADMTPDSARSTSACTFECVSTRGSMGPCRCASSDLIPSPRKSVNGLSFPGGRVERALERHYRGNRSAAQRSTAQRRCATHETRDTRHEIRDTRRETRDARHETQHAPSQESLATLRMSCQRPVQASEICRCPETERRSAVGAARHSCIVISSCGQYDTPPRAPCTHY